LWDRFQLLVKEVSMSIPDLMANGWFQMLTEEVRQELLRLAESQSDPRPAWKSESEQLDAKIVGWSQSLAKADLAATVRATLEGELEKALVRKSELECHSTEYANTQTRVEEVLDPNAVVKQLNRLADVLAANDPTRANLELSLHIDQINCFDDGTVVLRTCKLGALTGAVDLLAAPDPGTGKVSNADSEVKEVNPRRRARLRTDPFAEDRADLEAASHFAADPERFAGLADHWFWEDVFQIPDRICWAEEHAAEIASLRSAGLTQEQLAKQFGTTLPTIRKALRLAAETDPSLRDLPRKMPRRRWEEDHAEEVAKLRREGKTMKELVAHFGKSEPTILKALRFAAERESKLPDQGADQM